MPNAMPEPTIANVLYAQARLEGKIDATLAQQERHRLDIETLFKRTGQHGLDIAQLKANTMQLDAQQEQTISRGLATATIVLALLSIVITFIFNIAGLAL